MLGGLVAASILGQLSDRLNIYNTLILMVNSVIYSVNKHRFIQVRTAESISPYWRIANDFCHR